MKLCHDPFKWDTHWKIKHLQPYCSNTVACQTAIKISYMIAAKIILFFKYNYTSVLSRKIPDKTRFIVTIGNKGNIYEYGYRVLGTFVFQHLFLKKKLVVFYFPQTYTNLHSNYYIFYGEKVNKLCN